MHSPRPAPRLALALALLAAACGAPDLGGKKVTPPPAITAPRLALTGATVNAAGKVEVTYTVRQGETPAGAEVAAAFEPTFTLAVLDADPVVAGQRAWRSLLLTGRQLLTAHPQTGPGTPPEAVLEAQRQPGAESATSASPGAVADLGGGAFRYTFAAALPDAATLPRTLTLRVGAWLEAASPSADTAATLDFVPDGGAPERYELVVDADCHRCHVLVRGHQQRSGVRLCATCHTTQNADPDTQDPAAVIRALTVSPLARTVEAGTTDKQPFTATLLYSTSTVTWALSPALGTLSAPSGAAVTYTPPAASAVTEPTVVTLTATVTQPSTSASGAVVNAGYTFTHAAAITVVPPPAVAPAVRLNPSAVEVAAQLGAPAIGFKALGSFGTTKLTWTAKVGSVTVGTLATPAGTNNETVTWTPPVRVTAPATVTLTATAGTETGTATITLLPGAPGSATPDTNPNPLDFGRLAHRLHRGKRLPTLYASSNVAAAPAVAAGATLPTPFRAGSTGNPVLPGARFTVVGDLSRERVIGRINTWATGRGVTRSVAAGNTFPRDLRDCAACHGQAADRALVHTATHRRTCAGCHPDVWYQDTATSPITDQAHFAHTGGPQDDDTRCAGCHVAGGARLKVDNEDVHQPPKGPRHYNPLTVTLVKAANVLPGQKPVVYFTLADRQGAIERLNSSTPLATPSDDAGLSPVPRKVTSLRFQLAGTTRDYLVNALPRNTALVETAISSSVTAELLPCGEDTACTAEADCAARCTSLAAAAPPRVLFRYAFPTLALPADATGSWTILPEASRSATLAYWNKAAGTFAWPYTPGESASESAPSVPVSVDVTAGATDLGSPEARRVVVSMDRCNSCHARLLFHSRDEARACVLCHTPDATDWSARAKVNGNVDLAATYDGVEERSIHLKVMVHRLHTNSSRGTAQLDIRPYYIASYYWTDGTFPGDLADCRACHEGESFTPEAVPADAAPTTANETATVLHQGSALHVAGEPSVPPITAACLSCHGTGTAAFHAAKGFVDGKELCATCHGANAPYSVYKLHGLTKPSAR